MIKMKDKGNPLEGKETNRSGHTIMISDKALHEVLIIQ